MSNKDMRHAFQQGVSWTKARVWTNQTVSYEDRAKAALEHYPKKLVTRSRVVTIENLEYAIANGKLVVRDAGSSRNFHATGWSVENIMAFAGLVANPTETVEVDE
jgi:hypothetical protein